MKRFDDALAEPIEQIDLGDPKGPGNSIADPRGTQICTKYLLYWYLDPMGNLQHTGPAKLTVLRNHKQKPFQGTRNEHVCLGCG